MAISLQAAMTAVLLIVSLAMPPASHAFDFPSFPRSALSSGDKRAIDKLEQEQDWNSMRELARMRLKTKGNEAAWLFVDGYALQKLERYDEAIPQYRLALLIRTDYMEAQNELGRCLMATGQFDAAISTFISAIGKKPDYWQAYYNMALAHVRKQDPRSARIYLEQLRPRNKAMAVEIEENEIRPLESKLEQARIAEADRKREQKRRIELESLEKEVAVAKAIADAKAPPEKSLQPEAEAAITPPKSREEKLKELKRMYAKKLITREAYRSRQKELLEQQ